MAVSHFTFLMRSVTRTVGIQSIQQKLLHIASADVADELHLEILNGKHQGIVNNICS